jgi:hypothetical protein
VDARTQGCDSGRYGRGATVRRNRLVRRQNEDEWVSAQDHTPAQWVVHDGILTVSKAPGVGSIETKQKVQELPAAHRVSDSRKTSPAAVRRGETAASFSHRSGRATQATSFRFSMRYNNHDLCQRPGRQHLQTERSAGESGAQTGRMAELRRGVDGADIQRRRLGQDAGLGDGLVQRRAGAESL